MEQYSLPLGLLGAGIILVLSAYAGWLLSKLYKQKELQEKVMNAAITERNHKIIDSVDIIASATLQKQCDLSEAAIRLYMIMVHLQGDKKIEFEKDYPALFELYDIVKDMPRGKERKEIRKQDRMRQDLIRIEAETRLEQKISTELENILIFTGAKKPTLHS